MPPRATSRPTTSKTESSTRARPATRVTSTKNAPSDTKTTKPTLRPGPATSRSRTVTLSKQSPEDDVESISRQMNDVRLTADAAAQPAVATSATVKTSRPARVGNQAVDKLASDIADRLALGTQHTGSSKGKEKALPLDDRAIASDALQALRKVSQTLADAVQLGWRTSAPTKAFTVKALRGLVASVDVSIQTLRSSPFGRPVDVERTIVHMTGRLVSLELIEDAQRILRGCQPCIALLYSQSLHEQQPSRSTNIGDTWLLPLPDEACELEEPVAAAIGAFHLHSVQALLRVCDTSAVENLLEGPNILHWHAWLSHSLPEQQCSALMGSTFQAVAKYDGALPPDTLFRLRSWGLRCLIRSYSLKEDPFWDQAGKYSVSYVKASGPESWGPVCLMLDDLFDAAAQRDDHNKFCRGRGFVGICEYRLKFARATKNNSDLKRVKLLLDRSSSRPIEDGSSNIVDADVAAAQLCASISEPILIIERLLDDPSSEFGPLRLAALTVEDCTKFCSQPGISGTLREKIDQALERLRALSTGLLSPGTSSRNSSKNSPDDSDDNLVPPSSQIERQDYLVAVSKLLAAVLQHFSSLPSPRYVVACVQSYIVLAQISASGPASLPTRESYAFLEKALTVLQATVRSLENVPTSAQSESLRAISLAHWVFATTLYRQDQIAAAVPYLTQACEGGELALAAASRDDPPPSWREALAEQMPKRWELLGCCEARTGSRKSAQSAYVRGLLCSQAYVTKLGEAVDQTTSFASLLPDPFFRGMFSLLERFTQLSTYELLAPETVSVRHIFADLEDGDFEISGVASLVERQYQYLASSPGARSTGARTAMKCLLDDAIVFYQPQRFPIRRARALVKKLEQAYFDDEQDKARHIVEEIRELLRCDAASTAQSYNVDVLKKALSSTRDFHLLPLCPTLLATTYLWSALISHRTTRDDSVSHDVHHCISKALAILKEAYLAKPTALVVASPPAPSSAAGSVKVPKRVLSDTQNRSAKAKPSARPVRRAKAIPKGTPMTPVAAQPAPQQLKPRQLFDDFTAFDSLLGMCEYVASMLGLDLLKFESLRVRLALYQQDGSACLSDGYQRVCTDLAQEYVSLGRYDLAGAMFADALSVLEKPGNTVSTEARISLYLRYAAATAAGGNLEQGLAAYAEASSLADILAAEPVPSGITKPLHRVHAIARAAVAADAFSTVQSSRDDTVSALGGLLQSLRLWNRASYMLERINQTETKPTAKTSPRSPNPFQVSEPTEVSDITPEKKGSFSSLQWVVAQGIVGVLFNIARQYCERGSPRESEYFLNQALALAESLQASGVIGRARICLAEVKVLSGLHDDAQSLLERANALLEFPHADGVNALRISAISKAHGEDVETANTLFAEASAALESLERNFAEIEYRDTPEGGQPPANLLPSLAAAVWRQQIWLLRDVAEDGSAYTELLDKFLSLPASRHTKAEENILMGNLSMNEVYARFRADIALSSLPESTVAIPSGMHGGDIATSPSSTRDLFSALTTAEKFFWYFVEECNGHRGVSQFRDASTSISLIRAYQVALGAKSKNAATVATSLLDWSTAPTLRHELVDCIGHKFVNGMPDDLAWRSMSITGSPVRKSQDTKRRAVLRFTAESDDDDDNESDGEASTVSMRTYWQDVCERYKAETCDAVSLAKSPADCLPDNWTVVSVSMTEDKSTLIVSRQRPRREPVIIYLPINRQDRRDDTGEDQFTWEMAMEELVDIIHTSNETSRNGRNIVEREGRVAWWAQRVELDARMKTFVENVEYCWLGVFKTAFSQPVPLTQEQRVAFRIKLEGALRRNGCMHEKRGKQRLHIDDALLDCFSSLSPKCRDEELEDLAYFVLDLFQLHGAQVAVSEIDIDQLAVDLRTVLEEHSAALARTRVQPIADHHLFLVLDKNVQGIPWESIPILRGQSVSRIPSMSFLIDRIHLARHLRGLSALPTESEAASGKNVVDRATVDPRKTFYILNPSGDLLPTQKRFQTWLDGMRHAGWKGIVGRVPSEEELVNALTNHDLVIYFGHGGAEQYIRAHKIRNLPRCAATMLWGCSSGALKDMGTFDRIGTPYNYMVAGCPSFVATLWDVTDKDIDGLADSVFQKLRLDERAVRSWSPLQRVSSNSRGGARIALASPRKRAFTVATDGGAPDTPVGRLVRGNSGDDKQGMSVVTAVATSRDGCKLPYLTGAAPVVYGIPFYL